MKITHNKVGQNLNLQDTKGAGKTSGAKGNTETASTKLSELGSSEDATKVEFSTRAQDIKRAKEIAMASPDVDEAKVSRLQKLIDEKKYSVDAKAIADKMVDEQMKWE